MGRSLLVLAALSLLVGSTFALYDQTGARLDPDCSCQTGFEVNCTDPYPMLRAWELLTNNRCNETGANGVHPKCALNKSCSLWFYVMNMYRYGEQRAQQATSRGSRAAGGDAIRPGRTGSGIVAYSRDHTRRCAASGRGEAASRRSRHARACCPAGRETDPETAPRRLPAQHLARGHRGQLPLLPGQLQRLHLLQLLPASLLQLVLPAVPQVRLHRRRGHALGVGDAQVELRLGLLLRVVQEQLLAA